MSEGTYQAYDDPFESDQVEDEKRRPRVLLEQEEEDQGETDEVEDEKR